MARGIVYVHGNGLSRTIIWRFVPRLWSIQKTIRTSAKRVVAAVPMSLSMLMIIFSVARIPELLRSSRRRSRVAELRWRRRNALRRWWKTGRDGDDWMSDGNEFQRSDAATGNIQVHFAFYCSDFSRLPRIVADSIHTARPDATKLDGFVGRVGGVNWALLAAPSASQTPCSIYLRPVCDRPRTWCPVSDNMQIERRASNFFLRGGDARAIVVAAVRFASHFRASSVNISSRQAATKVVPRWQGPRHSMSCQSPLFKPPAELMSMSIVNSYSTGQNITLLVWPSRQ